MFLGVFPWSLLLGPVHDSGGVCSMGPYVVYDIYKKIYTDSGYVVGSTLGIHFSDLWYRL